jgi:hypothetical protein
VGSMEIRELSHEFSNINLKLKFTESIGHISIIHLDNMGDHVLSHIFAQEVLWTKFQLEKLLRLFSNSLSLAWLTVLSSSTNRKDMEEKLSWSV